MDNKDNDSLFSMYGTDEKKEVTQPEVVPPQQVVPQPEEKPEIIAVAEIKDNKPVPDEILKEIDNKKDTMSDKELLKLYIGPNAEKIMAGGLSFQTFFFGIYYLFYRKMYQQVLILFVLQIASSFFQAISLTMVSTAISSASLFYGIYLTIKFKGDYVAKAERTIREIKSNYQSEEEVINAVKASGGVDKRYWLLIVAFILISGVLNFSLGNNQIINNANTSDVEIHFPEEFKPFASEASRNQKDYTIGKYSYTNLVFNYRTNDNVCTFRNLFNNEYHMKPDLSADVAAKYMKEKHDIESKLEEKVINNRTFYYFYNERVQEDTYLLITDKSITEFNVSYIKDKNKKCHELLNYILENVEVKK